MTSKELSSQGKSTLVASHNFAKEKILAINSLLTFLEIQVLITAIENSDFKVRKDETYYVSTEDFPFLEGSTETRYNTNKKVVQGLRDKEIELSVEYANGKVYPHLCAWIITCKYFANRIGMQFHPDLIPFLQNLIRSNLLNSHNDSHNPTNVQNQFSTKAVK